MIWIAWTFLSWQRFKCKTLLTSKSVWRPRKHAWHCPNIRVFCLIISNPELHALKSHGLPPTSLHLTCSSFRAPANSGFKMVLRDKNKSAKFQSPHLQIQSTLCARFCELSLWHNEVLFSAPWANVVAAFKLDWTCSPKSQVFVALCLKGGWTHSFATCL